LRSELIKKEIRQKCPAVPGIFLFGSRIVPHLRRPTFWHVRDSTDAICPTTLSSPWWRRRYYWRALL